MQETSKNLAKAFVGESMARNRNAFYAKAAKKEWYEQIAEIFLVTANNEREHASWLMKLIQSLKTTRTENLDEIKVDAAVPTILNTTVNNIKAAIAVITMKIRSCILNLLLSRILKDSHT